MLQRTPCLCLARSILQTITIQNLSYAFYMENPNLPCSKEILGRLNISFWLNSGLNLSIAETRKSMSDQIQTAQTWSSKTCFFLFCFEIFNPLSQENSFRSFREILQSLFCKIMGLNANVKRGTWHLKVHKLNQSHAIKKKHDVGPINFMAFLF